MSNVKVSCNIDPRRLSSKIRKDCTTIADELDETCSSRGHLNIWIFFKKNIYKKNIQIIILRPFRVVHTALFMESLRSLELSNWLEIFSVRLSSEEISIVELKYEIYIFFQYIVIWTSVDGIIIFGWNVDFFRNRYSTVTMIALARLKLNVII